MSIDELRQKYANHEYMKQKLENYITNLPELMKSIEEDYCKKEEKKRQVIKLREDFINDFTRFFPFFYVSQTDLYIEKELNNISEDYIVHLISSKLEKPLVSSKHKITQGILKKIKETHLFQAPIDAYMLKKIIQQMPFPKQQSVYFLTIVGDILLNKDPLIYFMDASYKQYLKMLNQSIYFILNKSILDVFKHKYHDHKYSSCRILAGTCPEYEMTDSIRTIVASIHLSNKYGNSDGFIKSGDCSFSESALLLSTHTPDSLIQQFLTTYLVKEEGQTMTYKDVYFLWKLFLKENSLPFVLSQQNFKSSISYLCEGDICMMTTTMQMPLLKIKQFWEKYIVYDEDSYYELQELVELYQKHEKTTITIDSMKSILQIEYPHIHIDNNQVLNIKCLLWNKSVDIDNAMEMFKHSDSYSTNMDDMYLFYTDYTKKHHKRKVTQDYFEKCFRE
jgi:hypothetical protein